MPALIDDEDLDNRPELVVTGGNGFIGRALVSECNRRGVGVLALVRAPSECPYEKSVDFDSVTDLSGFFQGVRCVIHLAGRAHVLSEHSEDPLGEFRQVNVDLTKRVAHAAVEAGVRRLIFLSSIKVNGEESDVPFTSTMAPFPEDPYGTSKLEAEAALRKVADSTHLEVCIIRPPLVYGPHVKANVQRLVKLVQKGVPLPLAGVVNRRSLVAVDNLIDLVLRCVHHPEAKGIFLVSDGDDLSTPQLIRKIAAASGVPARLFRLPEILLRTLFGAIGRGAEYRKLVSNLQLDISATRRTLQWSPPLTVDQAINKMVNL